MRASERGEAIARVRTGPHRGAQTQAGRTCLCRSGRHMSAVMKPLCFVGVVDDGYQEYLPLFACFALQAYPDAELILYHAGGPLRAEVREALHALRDLGSIDARPLGHRYDPDEPQSLKSLRWVLYDDDFAGYENVYIGDVDMLIVRQEPSLCAARLRHSAAIERPYSNRVRPGTNLVAGISHFVRAQEYFPRVLPRMLDYREQIGAGTLRIHNEELLYRLLQDTVGLPERPVALQTHHGIHLRALHRVRELAVQRARTDYFFRIDFEPHLDGFLAVARAPRCADLLERLSRIESTPQLLARYPKGGPAATSQFRNVLSLCDDLLAERAQATP
ncbi:MAG: hypothetical protein ABI629_02330 [bacterium]